MSMHPLRMYFWRSLLAGGPASRGVLGEAQVLQKTHILLAAVLDPHAVKASEALDAPFETAKLLAQWVPDDVYSALQARHFPGESVTRYFGLDPAQLLGAILQEPEPSTKTGLVKQLLDLEYKPVVDPDKSVRRACLDIVLWFRQEGLVDDGFARLLTAFTVVSAVGMALVRCEHGLDTDVGVLAAIQNHPSGFVWLNQAPGALFPLIAMATASELATNRYDSRVMSAEVIHAFQHGEKRPVKLQDKRATVRAMFHVVRARMLDPDSQEAGQHLSDPRLLQCAREAATLASEVNTDVLPMMCCYLWTADGFLRVHARARAGGGVFPPYLEAAMIRAAPVVLQAADVGFDAVTAGMFADSTTYPAQIPDALLWRIMQRAADTMDFWGTYIVFREGADRVLPQPSLDSVPATALPRLAHAVLMLASNTDTVQFDEAVRALVNAALAVVRNFAEHVAVTGEALRMAKRAICWALYVTPSTMTRASILQMVAPWVPGSSLRLWSPTGLFTESCQAYTDAMLVQATM